MSLSKSLYYILFLFVIGLPNISFGDPFDLPYTNKDGSLNAQKLEQLNTKAIQQGYAGFIQSKKYELQAMSIIQFFVFVKAGFIPLKEAENHILIYRYPIDWRFEAVQVFDRGALYIYNAPGPKGDIKFFLLKKKDKNNPIMEGERLNPSQQGCFYLWVGTASYENTMGAHVTVPILKSVNLS